METAQKRLLKDFKKIMKDPPEGINASPNEENLLEWQAIMLGPADTPWEGGTFTLSLTFTSEYPTKPPEVRFLTKMFHPNIYTDGSICLDVLKSQWTPIYDVTTILVSIQSMLSDPNPASPANGEAAELYSQNRREYDRRVRAVVEETWEDDEDDDDDDDEDEEDDDGEAGEGAGAGSAE